MPQSPPFLAAGALTLAVSACASAAMPNDLPADAPHGASQYERPNDTQPGAKPPVPRRNPAAIAYEVVFTIHDAPGPFADMHASFGYDVADHRCLPRLGGMSGTRVDAHRSMDMPLERIGPSQFRGLVYDDLFVAEDYYGLGVCKWVLTGVGIGLRATGADTDARFSEGLTGKDVLALGSARGYFERRFYPRGPIDAMPVPTTRDLARFKPEVRDRLFSIEVRARRVRP